MRNAIVIVTGKKGSGKSQWVKTQLLPRALPAIVIDTMYEYGGYGRVYSAESFFVALESGESSNLAIIQDSFEGLEEVIDAAYSFKPHTLIVEEAHQFMSAYSISAPLERLARQGRHRQINIVAVTQRIGDFPERFISQADHLILFQQRGRLDMPKLDKFLAVEVSARVRALPLYEHIHVRL